MLTRKSAGQNRYGNIHVVVFSVVEVLFDLNPLFLHPIGGFEHINSIFIGQHIKTVWKHIAAKKYVWDSTFHVLFIRNKIGFENLPADHWRKSTIEANEAILAVNCFNASYWSLSFTSSTAKVI